MSDSPDSERRVLGVPPTSLVELQLSDHTRSILRRNRIETVEALTELGPKGLRLLRGIGPFKYREIQEALRTAARARRSSKRRQSRIEPRQCFAG